MYRSIFFDYGGTLMDLASDGESHYHVMQKVKAKFALEESVESLAELYNRSVARSYAVADCVYRNGRETSISTINAMLEKNGISLDEEMQSWFRNIYIETHCEHIRLFPETVKVLTELREMGISLGIISDVDDDFLFSQLNKLNIKRFFDTITTSEEAQVCKPHNKIFEMALSRGKTTARESIYVGDHPERDMMGAKRMGMTTVLRGNGPCEHADFIITNLMELLPIVRKGAPATIKTHL